MLLDTAITELRHFLDEMEVDNSHWDDERLVVFLNEGQGDVASRLPGELQPKLSEIHKQNLQDSESEYEFTEDNVRIDYIKAYSRNCKIVSIPYTNAFFISEFETPTILEPAVTIFGKYITVYPTPTTTYSDGLQTFYVRPPNDMNIESGDTDPEIPLFSHRWMILYAAYKCLLEDNDGRYKDIFAQYNTKFKKYEEVKRGTTTRSSST
jgi:hypothetical protein